jgi:hypothetical protein
LIGNGLTQGDVLGCLRGVAAFAPVLLAPGYCLGWASNLLGFRSRQAGERIAWSIALSFGVVAICSVELAKDGSLALVCWLAVLCTVGFAGIVVAEALAGKRAREGHWSPIALGAVAAWVLFAVLELVDVGVGNRLYLSVTVYDHALRAAFVDAVMRVGVPPANPLYWPGHAAPMRYYYFWYVVTAAAGKLGGVTARQATIASVVWAGLGLTAIMALYCRHFLGERSTGVRRPQMAVALGLLAVTGLDILPVIAMALFRVPTDADMEWWSSDKVTSWMDSVLWVPHHIAGLICCLLGFLLVWMSKGASVGQRRLCAVIAGVSFASAFGLSAWVPVAFALVMIAWIVWVPVCEPESRGRIPALLGAGAIAVVALLPYLRELRSASQSAAVNPPGPAHILRFGVRRIIDPDGLLAVPWIAEMARAHPALERVTAELLLLAPGYFVELGFFGLILIVAMQAARRSKLDEATRTALALTVAGLGVSTFLRSTVIEYNDFGFRSILIVQFFLLLLAVRWYQGAFEPVRGWMRGLLLTTAGLGLAATVYQAIDLRIYLPVEEKLGRPDQIGLSERAMAWRLGFDAMDQRIPKKAVIQFNPVQPSDFFLYAEMLHVRRQIAETPPGCGAAFGGDASACAGIERSVGRIFSPGTSLTAVEARTECGRLGVDDLVATRWDGVWADRQDWVWTLPAAVDTGDVRVLDCSK